jgi:putative membrane protein
VLLSNAEADAIDARIARVEVRTGVQVVAAVAARSDGYPEVVWQAFALGAALAALAVVVLDIARPDWMAVDAALSNVLPIIGAGAASALAAVAVPAYARLFVNPFRSAGEVRQRAQAMFLTRQLFRTRARNGVLLFASLFEHDVEVVADIAFDGRVDEREWHSVVTAMTPLLARRRLADALTSGLDALETLLVAKGFSRASGGARDELSNRPIEDRDA